MKKTLLIAAGVSILALTSCKKDYSCKCVDTDDESSIIYAITNATSSDAETRCDTFDATYEDYSTECSIEE